MRTIAITCNVGVHHIHRPRDAVPSVDGWHEGPLRVRPWTGAHYQVGVPKQITFGPGALRSDVQDTPPSWHGTVWPPASSAVEICFKLSFAVALLWNIKIAACNNIVTNQRKCPYSCLIQVGGWRRRPLHCAVSDRVGWGYQIIWGCWSDLITESFNTWLLVAGAQVLTWKCRCRCTYQNTFFRCTRRLSWLSMCSLDFPLRQASFVMAKTGLTWSSVLP